MQTLARHSGLFGPSDSPGCIHPLEEGILSRILVIDDDADVCDVLRDYLEQQGYTVQAATSIDGASAYLRRTPPDLILLDVLMPDANGLDLLTQLKASHSDSHIVIITGLNDYRIADLFYEAGADGFLAKPLRLKALSRTVHRLLNRPTN